MNPVYQLIITFTSMIAIIVGFVYWYWVNNIWVEISSYDAGVFKSQGGRFRKGRNGKLYRFSDFSSRHPLPLKYLDYRDFLIIAETAPLFGYKKVLNLKIVRKPGTVEVNKTRKEIAEELRKTFGPWNERLLKTMLGNKMVVERKKEVLVDEILLPWKPPVDFHKKELLSDFMYTSYLNEKIAIYNDSKVESGKDMLMEVVIPIALIILAMALVVFLPKILEAIREPVLTYVKQETSAWQDILKGMKPGG